MQIATGISRNMYRTVIGNLSHQIGGISKLQKRHHLQNGILQCCTAILLRQIGLIILQKLKASPLNTHLLPAGSSPKLCPLDRIAILARFRFMIE